MRGREKMKVQIAIQLLFVAFLWGQYPDGGKATPLNRSTTEDEHPEIVSAYAIVGDSTVLITASEDLNMEVSGPAGNWAVTPGFSVSGVYTASTDLFVGKTDGKIEHYQNNGGLDFTLVNSNFQSIDVGSNAAPTFVDIDNDGDLDMFIGENGGKIHYYKNRSTDDTIDFDQISTNYNFIDVGSRSRPAFADLNNDGKYDLLIGNSSGKIYYYQNIGTPTDATFLLISDNAFDIDVGDDASLIFIDIDGDTDLDFFVGNSNGQIRYYRNIGGVDLPLFERAETYDSGYWTTISGNAIPAFTDIENDGDLDLFIGNPMAKAVPMGSYTLSVIPALSQIQILFLRMSTWPIWILPGSITLPLPACRTTLILINWFCSSINPSLPLPRN
jgi:hypothetical protein